MTRPFGNYTPDCNIVTTIEYHNKGKRYIKGI